MKLKSSNKYNIFECFDLLDFTFSIQTSTSVDITINVKA